MSFDITIYSGGAIKAVYWHIISLSEAIMSYRVWELSVLTAPYTSVVKYRVTVNVYPK